MNFFFWPTKMKRNLPLTRQLPVNTKRKQVNEFDGITNGVIEKSFCLVICKQCGQNTSQSTSSDLGIINPSRTIGRIRPWDTTRLQVPCATCKSRLE